MKHAERCDSRTYCGRRVLPDARALVGDIPRSQIVAGPSPDLCKRCARGLRNTKHDDAVETIFDSRSK